MSNVDRLIEVPEHLSWVYHQPVIVTEGEAGAFKVGAEDRDLHAAHD